MVTVTQPALCYAVFEMAYLIVEGLISSKFMQKVELKYYSQVGCTLNHN